MHPLATFSRPQTAYRQNLYDGLDAHEHCSLKLEEAHYRALIVIGMQ